MALNVKIGPKLTIFLLHTDLKIWNFGLQYCEAKTSTALRTAADGLSDLKFGILPPEGPPQLWLSGFGRIQIFEK